MKDKHNSCPFCDNNDKMVPLFPNDIGNCAYVDTEKLVKETFSDEFMLKCFVLQ